MDLVHNLQHDSEVSCCYSVWLISLIGLVAWYLSNMTGSGLAQNSVFAMGTRHCHVHPTKATFFIYEANGRMEIKSFL